MNFEKLVVELSEWSDAMTIEVGTRVRFHTAIDTGPWTIPAGAEGTIVDEEPEGLAYMGDDLIVVRLDAEIPGLPGNLYAHLPDMGDVPFTPFTILRKFAFGAAGAESVVRGS